MRCMRLDMQGWSSLIFRICAKQYNWERGMSRYWTTAAEREGKNPMQTLLPYIALLTILSPFAILAVAYANNWIKLPN